MSNDELTTLMKHDDDEKFKEHALQFMKALAKRIDDLEQRLDLVIGGGLGE